jgi:putative ABC transport system permease protein
MWKAYTADYLKYNHRGGTAIRIAAGIAALFLSILSGMFYNLRKYDEERIIQENIGWVFPTMLLLTVMASVSLIIIIHNAFAVSMSARLHQFGIFSSVGATPKQIRRCLVQEAIALCALPLFLGNLLGIGSCIGLIRMTNLLGADIVGRRTAVYIFSPAVFLLTLLLCVLTILFSAWLPARALSKLTPMEAIRSTGELQLKRKKNSPLLRLFFGIEGELAGNNLKAQRKALRMGTLSLFISFLAFTMMQCVMTLMQVSIDETYTKRYQGIWDLMVTVQDETITDFGQTKEIQELSGVRNAIVYQKTTAKRLITSDEMSEELRANEGFSHATAKDVLPTEEGFMVNAPLVILDDESFLAYCKEIGINPNLTGGIILNQIRDVTDKDFRHPKFMPYVKENPVSVFIIDGDSHMKGEDEQLQNVSYQILTDGDQSQSNNEQLSTGTDQLISSYSQQLVIGKQHTVEIPILSYTTIVPPLREEYAKIDYYELVHFLPVSLWSTMQGSIGNAESDIQICILGRENVSLESLEQVQQEITQLLSADHTFQIENRIQEQQNDDKTIKGMMAIFGGFCVLLAIIGLGNIFSNTLGYVQQRRKEVARYFSVGMTPQSIRKMFCIEGLVIAGKPVLLAIPITVFALWVLMSSSYMDPGSFLPQIPYLAIFLYILVMGGMVGLAYYLGWRQVRDMSLSQVLQDDTV